MTNNELMWVFTILVVIGFIMTYRNLQGETLILNSKYEGLIVSLLGLCLAIYTGVNSTPHGLDKFKSLYM